VSWLAAGVLVLSVTVSTGLLLVVVALVWYLDRYDREPVHLVVGVFLWGAAVAPLLSLVAMTVLERVARPDTVAAVVLLGPTVEECLKAAAVLLVVALSTDFDNPTDGIVYGTAVGLGFAVAENTLYGIAAAGGETGVGSLVAARTVFTAGMHALASSAFGGFLGYAYLSRRRAVRLSWTIGGLATAVLLHAAWNLALLRLTQDAVRLRPWLLAVPVLYGLYLVTLALFLSSEHRIIKRRLQEEVDLATVPPWVVDVIPYYRRRIRADWWPFRSERTVLSRLLTRLAFRKHAISRLPDAEAQIAGLEVVQIRNRIRQVLGPQPGQ
jgi:RsiW-degrading membrane proteinase PrsW (M82 family)